MTNFWTRKFMLRNRSGALTRIPQKELVLRFRMWFILMNEAAQANLFELREA